MKEENVVNLYISKECSLKKGACFIRLFKEDEHGI